LSGEAVTRCGLLAQLTKEYGTMNKHLSAALALLTFSVAASAQSAYGLASVGMSKSSFDCLGAPSCDKSDIAFKVMGGYKFMPNFAGEVGYFDFGKQKLSGGGASLDFQNTAWGISVAYLQDIAPTWNFVGRIGVAQVKTKLSGSVQGVGSASDSDSNAAIYAGLGIGYKLSKTVSVDGAWDFSKGKYSKNGVDESGNLNAFSVGLTFGF
jgi:Opacity protein and related surface antigens